MDPAAKSQPETRDPHSAAQPEPAPSSGLPNLTLDERRLLLALTRQALTASLAGHGLPEPDPSPWPPIAALPFGCFVTLTANAELRGCIGNLTPRLPLHRALCLHAVQAAREDRRFQPVGPNELEHLLIEISILGPLHPLPSRQPNDILSSLRPGIDGVLLRVGTLSATYLPQVWTKIPRPQDFLQSLSHKAGLSPHAWRQPNAEISTYEVLAFSESHHEGEQRDRLTSRRGP